MRIFLLLAAVTDMAQPSPSELPGQLQCKMSGEAGCGYIRKGVLQCVGAGRGDRDIALDVYASERRIVLNKLVGRIIGSEPLEYSKSRRISWNPPIIALSNIRAQSLHDISGVPFTSIELHSDKYELEFTCEPE